MLVHCAAGISRSTTVVLAYLLLARNMTLHQAFEHTISRRHVVWPNNGFMQLLITIEASKSSQSGGAARPTIDLPEYVRWGEFDEAAYYAARKVDRDPPTSGPLPGTEASIGFMKMAISPGPSAESVE